MATLPAREPGTEPDPTDATVPASDAAGRAAANVARLTRFRRANVLVGFASSSAVAVANVVYFALTPDEPNRPLLWALQALAITLGALTVIVARRWLPARPMIHAWTTSQLVLTAIAVAADGGVTSPLMVVMVVPLALAAMALPTRPVLLHTGVGILGMLIAGAVTGTLTVGVALIWAVNIGAIALIGSGVAQNTRRLTRELDAANRELLERARTDSLTGCLNHRAFFEEVDRGLARARRLDAPVALLLLDVDHFKEVNDTHGHPVGDEVLVAVADALRASTRAGDVVGRTGGEEFAVLMPDATLDAADSSAERIRDAVSRADGPVRVTVSAGLAVFPVHGETSRRLVRRADRALYAAKDGGRDRLVIAEG